MKGVNWEKRVRRVGEDERGFWGELTALLCTCYKMATDPPPTGAWDFFPHTSMSDVLSVHSTTCNFMCKMLPLAHIDVIVQSLSLWTVRKVRAKAVFFLLHQTLSSLWLTVDPRESMTN